MSAIRKQRALVWIGLAMLLCWFFAAAVLMGFMPPPSPRLSVGDVVAIYAAHPIKFQLGVIIFILSGLYMIPLSLVMSVQMSRDEQGMPILSILQGIGGAASAVFIALPGVLFAAASYSVERNPDITRSMHELAFLMLIIPISAQAIQAIPVTIVALSPKKDEHLTAYPRWVGYLCLWQVLAVDVAPVAVIFKSGPFAWDGLFPYWLPIVMFGGYFSIQIYLILRALKRQERVELSKGATASGPEPVGEAVHAD